MTDAGVITDEINVSEKFNHYLTTVVSKLVDTTAPFCSGSTETMFTDTTFLQTGLLFTVYYLFRQSIHTRTRSLLLQKTINDHAKINKKKMYSFRQTRCMFWKMCRSEKFITCVKVCHYIFVFLFLFCVKISGESVIPQSHLFIRYRGCEWSFQKYGSRKIFVKFLGSRSHDFCADVSVSESRIFAR